MDALKGQAIHGQGNTEHCWAASEPLQSLPAADLGRLLGHCTRLVVIAPHPDDEILGCGGLMAAAIQAGLPVLVIALTDGEAAYPQDPHWQPARLAPVRRRELRNAVLTLGGDDQDVVHIGIADGQIAHCPDRTARALSQIRARDTVLVTYGSDGHPDHEAAAAAAVAACASSGARLIQYPIWCWHWADPATATFLLGQAWRFPLDPAIQARKQAALEAFSSQTGRCWPAPVAPILPPHVLARFLRPYEVYLT